MRPKDKGTKAENKARKAYEEAVLQAFRNYTAAKEQAEIVHEKALKQAIDKKAREKADIKYKETLEQARKVRDDVMDEAQKAFNDVMSKRG